MNLTLGDAADLPLAAALLESDDVLASTPEWRGPLLGTVAYPVRRTRLLVAPHPEPASAGDEQPLLQALLDSLDAAAAAARGWDALQLGMVAASLRLVSGRRIQGTGAVTEVIEMAVAGIGRRTALSVEVQPPLTMNKVAAPEVVALVLVQLAVNAERHDAADSVSLSADATGLHVSWRGSPEPVRTSRRRAERRRWGLGFARVAADHLGATLHPPRLSGGTAVASLELGVPRLALPLAAVRGGQVSRATRAWDEETALPPGSHVHGSALIDDLLAAARSRPGEVVAGGSMTARASRNLVWLAVPPDPPLDRARDVLTGLSHEQALLRGADPANHATVRGMAILLAARLGVPAPRVPAAVWSSRLRGLRDASGADFEVPAYDGIGALDPDATFVIARRGGDGFEVAGDRLWLKLSARGRADPVAASIAAPSGDRVALS